MLKEGTNEEKLWELWQHRAILEGNRETLIVQRMKIPVHWINSHTVN